MQTTYLEPRPSLLVTKENPPLEQGRKGMQVASLAKLLEVLSFPGSASGYTEQYFEKKHFKAGKVVFSRSSKSRALYAVQTGTLKTKLIDPLGIEYAVYFPGQGDLVGYEFLTCVEFESETMTVTDATLIAIPMDHAHALIRDCDAFSEGLYRLLGQYLSFARDRILSQARLKAPAKVAKFLMTELGKSKLAAGRKSVTLQMKRGDIASYLGIRLETLSRIFCKFEIEGLILRCKATVKIRNPHGLNAHINGTALLEQAERTTRNL